MGGTIGSWVFDGDGGLQANRSKLGAERSLGRRGREWPSHQTRGSREPRLLGGARDNRDGK